LHKGVWQQCSAQDTLIELTSLLQTNGLRDKGGGREGKSKGREGEGRE